MLIMKGRSNKEISEVNAEFNAKYISDIPEDDSSMSCGMGMRR